MTSMHEDADGWRYQSHRDGVEQVYLPTPHPAQLFIERVNRPKTRRKNWVIVNRSPPGRWRNAIYGPKISGPFPTLEAAKAAYLLIRASLT